MRELQNQIDHVVWEFVGTIAELARRHVASMTMTAFAPHVARGASPRRAGRGRPPGLGSAKRSQAELEALSKQFLAFVRKHPGLRIEQINKELGTTTSELALPIRKSIAQGLLTSKGQKRSTRYFAKQASQN